MIQDGNMFFRYVCARSRSIESGLECAKAWRFGGFLTLLRIASLHDT